MSCALPVDETSIQHWVCAVLQVCHQADRFAYSSGPCSALLTVRRIWYAGGAGHDSQ
jgi:hypothetical protein